MSTWSQGDLQLDDVRLHYYRTGVGEKPPLMLLHGFADNGLCWSEVAREWEADFDLICPMSAGTGSLAARQAEIIGSRPWRRMSRRSSGR